jgi:hypothetical protein
MSGGDAAMHQDTLRRRRELSRVVLTRKGRPCGPPVVEGIRLFVSIAGSVLLRLLHPLPQMLFQRFQVEARAHLPGSTLDTGNFRAFDAQTRHQPLVAKSKLLQVAGALDLGDLCVKHLVVLARCHLGLRFFRAR